MNIEERLGRGQAVVVEVPGPLLVRRGGTVRLSEQAEAAAREHYEYRGFADALGLDPPEERIRLVSMPRTEYDRLRTDADKLPDLLRQRSKPEGWSTEDQESYASWARSLGLEP